MQISIELFEESFGRLNLLVVTGKIKAIAPVADANAKTIFYLFEVFIKLATKFSETAGIDRIKIELKRVGLCVQNSLYNLYCSYSLQLITGLDGCKANSATEFWKRTALVSFRSCWGISTIPSL